MISTIALLFIVLMCVLCVLFVQQFGRASIPLVFVIMWHVVKLLFYVIAPFIDESLIQQHGILVEDLLFISLLKILIILSAAIGYLISVPKFGQKFISPKFMGSGFLAWNILAGFLFIALYWYFLGGFDAVAESFSNRGEATRGGIIFLSLAWCFFGLAIAVSIRVVRVSKQVLLVFVFSTVIFLSYGSRLLSIGFFAVWLISSLILNDRLPINLLSARWLLVIFVGFIVFTGAPLLRAPGAVDYYLAAPGVFISDALENWIEVLVRLAVPDIEFLVLKHFDTSNFWLGASFRDLVYFPCPVSFCVNKPPMDEGVYLYNISLYGSVTPGTPISELQVSSLPFETWSIWYANFGSIGVGIGGFLQGLVLGYVYRLTFSNDMLLRIVGAFSISLVGLGLFHITNLSFGLFFFPIFLAITSATFYRMLVRLLRRRSPGLRKL